MKIIACFLFGCHFFVHFCYAETYGPKERSDIRDVINIVTQNIRTSHEDDEVVSTSRSMDNYSEYETIIPIMGHDILLRAEVTDCSIGRGLDREFMHVEVVGEIEIPTKLYMEANGNIKGDQFDVSHRELIVVPFKRRVSLNAAHSLSIHGQLDETYAQVVANALMGGVSLNVSAQSYIHFSSGIEVSKELSTGETATSPALYFGVKLPIGSRIMRRLNQKENSLN